MAFYKTSKSIICARLDTVVIQWAHMRGIIIHVIAVIS